MKIWGIILLLLFIPIQSALALCDITNFRWQCDISTSKKPSASTYSLVYCGNTPLYVNQSQYELLTRYQRANINMVLHVNGEYITSPCVPAGRFDAKHPKRIPKWS